MWQSGGSVYAYWVPPPAQMDHTPADRPVRAAWPSGRPARGDGRPVVWLMGPFERYPQDTVAELRGSFRVVWVRRYHEGSAVWPAPDVVVLPDPSPNRDRTLAALQRSPAARSAPVVDSAAPGVLAEALLHPVSPPDAEPGRADAS